MADVISRKAWKWIIPLVIPQTTPPQKCNYHIRLRSMAKYKFKVRSTDVGKGFKKTLLLRRRANEAWMNLSPKFEPAFIYITTEIEDVTLYVTSRAACLPPAAALSPTTSRLPRPRCCNRRTARLTSRPTQLPAQNMQVGNMEILQI